METFVAIAMADVPMTENRGSRTNPASSVPATAPRVLNPYRKETCSPTSRNCSEANFVNTGRVPPISVVGTIIATTANR